MFDAFGAIEGDLKQGKGSKDEHKVCQAKPAGTEQPLSLGRLLWSPLETAALCIASVSF